MKLIPSEGLPVDSNIAALLRKTIGAISVTFLGAG